MVDCIVQGLRDRKETFSFFPSFLLHAAFTIGIGGGGGGGGDFLITRVNTQ